MSKKERRELQEAQRAAKAAGKSGGAAKDNTAKPQKGAAPAARNPGANTSDPKQVARASVNTRGCGPR